MVGVAIVTARKNSLRLKRKNRLIIKNQNLVDRSLKFAEKLKYIKHIILTTDDSFFINRKYKSSIIKINRPKYLAKKNSTSFATVKHALNLIKNKMNIKADFVLLLQPTSPFRKKIFIDSAYKKFRKFKGKYSVVSISKTKDKNKQNLDIVDGKINFTKKNNFQFNGNFYFAGVKFLMRYKSFFKNNFSLPYILNSKFSIDIDSKKDYLLAKKLS